MDAQEIGRVRRCRRAKNCLAAFSTSCVDDAVRRVCLAVTERRLMLLSDTIYSFLPRCTLLWVVLFPLGPSSERPTARPILQL